jgi:hypothetical protein
MPRLGYDQVDSKWLSIIPRVHELGTTDHILNGVLCLVLFGGAIDWWRRHKDKDERVNMFKDLKQRMKRKIHSKRLESHP